MARNPYDHRIQRKVQENALVKSEAEEKVPEKPLTTKPDRRTVRHHPIKIQVRSNNGKRH